MSKFQEAIIKQEAVVAAALSRLDELRAQAAAAELVDVVGKDFKVSFKVGRAETRREVIGLVLGRGLVKDVDSVRAQVGEGIDCELFTVPVSQLLSITAPSEEVKAPSEIAVAMGNAAVGESEAPAATDADALLADLVG